MTENWKPSVVAFFCNWCTYTAADLAGVSRMRYASNVRIIRLMCSGRVDPQFVLHAFAKGADGVLIGGCHPGDCHYLEGNYKALRRFRMLQRMVGALGIEPERLRLEWISAAEGEKVKRVIDDMVGNILKLGPLALPERFEAWDFEMRDHGDITLSAEPAPHSGGHSHSQATSKPQTEAANV